MLSLCVVEYGQIWLCDILVGGVGQMAIGNRLSVKCSCLGNDLPSTCRDDERPTSKLEMVACGVHCLRDLRSCKSSRRRLLVIEQDDHTHGGSRNASINLAYEMTTVHVDNGIGHIPYVEYFSDLESLGSFLPGMEQRVAQRFVNNQNSIEPGVISGANMYHRACRETSSSHF